MNNHPEKTALYVHPKLTVEVMQNLKAALANPLFPQEYREKALETLGGLTSRDLILYSLGKMAGIQAAEDAICSRLATEKAEQSNAI